MNNLIWFEFRKIKKKNLKTKYIEFSFQCCKTFRIIIPRHVMNMIFSFALCCYELFYKDRKNLKRNIKVLVGSRVYNKNRKAKIFHLKNTPEMKSHSKMKLFQCIDYIIRMLLYGMHWNKIMVLVESGFKRKNESDAADEFLLWKMYVYFQLENSFHMGLRRLYWETWKMASSAWYTNYEFINCIHIFFNVNKGFCLWIIVMFHMSVWHVSAIDIFL